MTCTIAQHGLVRRVVISGCSGGGKSSLLDEMQRRGFAVMPEVGRQVVVAQLQTDGDAVPWKNWRRFLELCVERGINQHRAAGELSVSIVLFDRSLIDNTMDDGLSDHLRKIRNDHRYDPVVYFTPPWPEIYRIDNERRHDFANALENYARLQLAYPALGYQVVEIPRVSVSERADWLSERLKA
jgi:predicted ATPase